MPRLIAYLRVSSEEQAQSGLGIEAQLTAIIAKAGKPDVIIKDEGYTGGTLDRPGLAELLDTVKKGDVVAVAKLDRLSRGDEFAAAWLDKEIVEKRKASILSAAGEGTGDDSPQGALMRTIIKAFASFELAIIKQRTSAAVKVKMEHKRRAREKTGGKHAPFGFDVVEIGGVKKLMPNEREQAAINTMRSMRDQGATLQEIGQALRVQGISPRAGGAWTPASIRKILLREKVEQAA